MKRFVFLLAVGLAGLVFSAPAAGKKIILVAGKPSHGPGAHEFRAGCLLFKSQLDKVPGVTSVVYSNGWPADAVLIYADGGGGHPAIQGDHKEILGSLAKKGVGIGFAHYGVEILKDKGGPEFLEWVGGYYEHQYSCNPMWAPDYKKFPNHPITRGVQPFSNKDEWYFNMRWRTDMKGITPLLVATPSDEVRKGSYVYPKGPYEHIIAASGREETLMWAFERPDGGRGFGFTGGHTHANWGNPNQLKIVLNALLWIAKADIPSGGVASSLTAEELQQNLDPKGGKK